eukprot:1633814-Pleurochrysis_carterae.AAC.1
MCPCDGIWRWASERQDADTVAVNPGCDLRLSFEVGIGAGTGLSSVYGCNWRHQEAGDEARMWVWLNLRSVMVVF